MIDERFTKAMGRLTFYMLLCSVALGIILKSFVIGAMCFGASFMLLFSFFAMMQQEQYGIGLLIGALAVVMIPLAAIKAMFDVGILWLIMCHFAAVFMLIAGLLIRKKSQHAAFVGNLLILMAVYFGIYAAFAPVLLGHRSPLAVSPGFGAIKDFLFAAATSPWGILYALILALLGHLVYGRGAAFFLPWFFLMVISSCVGSYPDVFNKISEIVQLNPVALNTELLKFAASTQVPAGFVCLSLGVLLIWLLVPVFIRQTTMQLEIQSIASLKQIFGTTFAQGMANAKMRQEGAAMLLYILLIFAGILSATIIIWKTLFLLPHATEFTFAGLTLADIRLPHWRPVWHYTYFIPAGIYFLMSRLFPKIQKNLGNFMTAAPGMFAADVVIAIVVALFFPAGVVLFMLGYLFGKITVIPLMQYAINITQDSPAIGRPQPERPRPAPEPESIRITPVPQAPTPVPATPKPAPQQRPAGEVLFIHEESITDIASLSPNEHLVLDSGGNLARYAGSRRSKSALLGELDSPFCICIRGDKIIIGDKAGKILIGNADSAPVGDYSSISLEMPFDALTVNGFGSISAFTPLDRRKVLGVFHASGKTMPLLDLGAERATTLAFSPDGRLLAIGTSGGDIMLFDMASRSITDTLKSSDMPSHAGGQPKVAHISFLDGNSLIVAYSSGRIARWEGASLRGDHNANGKITSLAIDPASGRVITGMYDGVVQVFPAALDKVIFSQKLHDAEVVKATLMQGRLISAGSDGTVRRTQV